MIWSVKKCWACIRPPLRALGYAIIVAAVALNLFIYNYHQFQPDVCAWSQEKADLRLLGFGDPQIREASATASWRTKLDIYGNDNYLGHVYRTMVQSLKPTHVAVLGDLLSSQWISDKQFHERVDRYQSRIFDKSLHNGHFINVSGNHDIGYAGEVTPERVARYQDRFGQLNFVQYYNGIRVAVLNSLTLDGPLYFGSYSDQAWEFLDKLDQEEFIGPTVLLTHIPLYKPDGICQDGPYFEYYGPEFGNALRAQNHLSKETSQAILDKVFKPGNPYNGVILTGHDHEGCESYYVHGDEGWAAQKYVHGIQGSVHEITVRSMMGEFGGNTGILTGIRSSNAWTFTFTLCPFVVQHWWWAAKVVAIVSILIVLPVFSLMALELI